MECVTSEKIIPPEEYRNRWNEKLELIRMNQNHPPEERSKNLDSSLKKIQSFINKIKLFNENHISTMLKECDCLNLSRHLSEIISAVLELKFKIVQLKSVIRVLSRIHQNYNTFSAEFFEAIHKKLISLLQTEVDERNMRIILRLYYDSIFSGMDRCKTKQVSKISQFLLSLYELDPFLHCNTIVYIIKNYSEEFGIHTKAQEEYFKQHQLDHTVVIFVSEKDRDSFIELTRKWHQTLCQKTLEVSKELRKMNEKHSHYLGLHGELTQEQKDAHKNLTTLFERIFSASKALSEILGEKFELPSTSNQVDDEEQLVKNVDLTPTFEEKVTVSTVWEDEDSRCFYEDLKDYTSILPIVSSKDVENLRKTIKESLYTSKRSSVKNEDNYDSDDDFDLVEYEKQKVSKNPIMDLFISKLQNCVNRDLIDGCVDEFLRYLNTKAHRRMIIDALYNLPRNRTDLIPFYSRFIATVSPYAPEISIEVSILLRREFFYHIRKFRQFNLEAKLKVVRYIGELVKFKIFSKADAIMFSRILLKNWQSHCVDMLCRLLDTCGRFLYLSPESHPLMVHILENIKRKSNSISDENHRFMMHNIILMCNPPEKMSKPRKEYTTTQLFIRHMIFNRLTRSNVTSVFESLQKIPWNDPSVVLFVVKCITSAWKLKHNNIPALASLIFILRNFYPDLAVYVVDNVLEEIRLGLETNMAIYNQRRIATIKFFGELFNFQIVESLMIYKVCYLLLTFGQQVDGTLFDDPPTNFTRILLICELLKTTSKYLIAENETFSKFSQFFTLFQAYIWQKKLNEHYTNNPFPASIDSIIRETFDLLKINKLMYKTPKEVADSVAELTRLKLSSANDSTKEYAKKCFKAQKCFSSTTSDSQYNHSNHDNDESIEVDENDANVDFNADKEFETAFQRTMVESINSQPEGRRSDNTLDLGLPHNLQNIYSNTHETFEKQIKDKECPQLKMLFLSKKNNKKCFKNVEILKSDDLAVSVMSKYHARKEEQAEVKRYILNLSNNEKSNNRPSSPKSSVTVTTKSLPIPNKKFDH